MGLTSPDNQPILRIARTKEHKPNVSSTTANTTILRNYAVTKGAPEACAATAVLALSLGVSDLFNNPSRIATQNTIDN